MVTTALRLATSPDAEGEPSRTPAERRADALGDICRFFLDYQVANRGGRHGPHLNVVVELPDVESGNGGRYVDGTPLSGVSLSTLLCDSALHRLVTTDRSTILDYGVATRSIPAPLWNALVLRDVTCRFPGCDRPAHWAEGHHVVWVERGGASNLGNLVLLCSRHHHRLHRRGWEAKVAPDGVFEVTAPDGRHWRTHPPRSRDECGEECRGGRTRRDRHRVGPLTTTSTFFARTFEASETHHALWAAASSA